MKIYEAVYMPQGNIHWEQVKAAELENMQWLDAPHIHAAAQACYNENALHVRLQATEKDILCRFNGDTDEVCMDSCLEFFFSPTADGRYFNIESNPNGALYVGIGYDRYRHIRLYDPQLRQQLQVQPFVTSDGWGVEMAIPASFIQLLYPGFAFAPGMQMGANFYKCGEDTKIPHYLSWNKVDVKEPDFHLPEFFGKLILK